MRQDYESMENSDSKCLESISAHNDAVNSVVVGLDGLVFIKAVDSTVKVWSQKVNEKNRATKHVFVKVLLR